MSDLNKPISPDEEPSTSKVIKKKLTLVLVVIVIGAVILFDIFMRADQTPFNSLDPRRSKGSMSEAALQIVEFVDFQCIECAHGAYLLQEYMQRYPEGISLSVKYYPLGDLNSGLSARYAHCMAEQDKFWPYHDLLFRHQASWRSLHVVEPYLKGLAQDLGARVEELSVCVEAKETRKIIFQERLMGDSYFVKMTPTYFVDGEMVVGAQELEKVLRQFFENQMDEYM
ncbi:MAG: protein-disulfide isomerase [Lysobacterales bacterium]|jgi:protein-disulfide isomerase